MPFPENYIDTFNEAKKNFKIFTDNIKVEDIDIKKSVRDIEGLSTFLIEEVEMNEKRVQNSLKNSIIIIMAQNDSQEICAICLSDINGKDKYTLECNHTFHTDCIVKWFRSSNGNCPCCWDNNTKKKFFLWCMGKAIYKYTM